MPNISRMVVTEVVAKFSPSQPFNSLLTGNYKRKTESVRWFGDPIRAVESIHKKKVKDPKIDDKGMLHFTIIEVFFGKQWRIARWTNVSEIGHNYGIIEKYL